MNQTNITFPTETYDYQKDQINLYYAICEILVAAVAVVGNALVIFVFRKERRLRRRTNYYIVSLAAADFLVGLLGIPFAILSSVGMPANLHACLFTVSLLVVLCTISIFCLVAVSVDRYWAILHPMGYSRNVRTKTAIVIISICWVTGSIIGFLPLMGWHKDVPLNERCFFLGVMDYNYLVFLYFGTIITPALLLAAFYAHIYRVVLKQLRRIVTMNPESGTSTAGCSSGGTMLRMLGAAQKREVKATQNLAIIVLFFMICWIPLYTTNCILAFCRDCQVNSTLMFSCIILSHLNSAGNPLLYAYHLRDFRAALKSFFCSLFGCEDSQVQQIPHHRTSLMASNNNYNHYRMHQSIENRNNSLKYSDSQIYYRRKSSEPKISTIVKNSAALAAATSAAGDVNEIWNIPEVSSESSESLKKTSIVRPGTPYHARKTSVNSQVNQGYVDTSSIDDDVFLDDTIIYKDEPLTETMTVQIVPRLISTSSPQLSRNLFFVEGDLVNNGARPKFVRSSSLAEKGDDGRAKRHKAFRLVGGMFKGKSELGRSLSDDGTASNESIPRNGTVVRNSCGS